MNECSVSVNLFPKASISWDDYLTIEGALCRLLAASKYDNAFERILSFNELLAEFVRLKNLDLALDPGKTFVVDSLSEWKKQSATFFEIRVLNMFCYRNFVFPQAARQAKQPLTDTKVLTAAFNTTILGKMDLEGIGRVDVGRAHKLKTRPLPGQVSADLWQRLSSKIQARAYFGESLAGLSVIAGCNNLVGDILSAVVYAKCQAMHKRKDEIDPSDLSHALKLVDEAGDSLSQLPHDQSSLYDSGFASPRLFNRLLAQMARLSS